MNKVKRVKEILFFLFLGFFFFFILPQYSPALAAISITNMDVVDLPSPGDQLSVGVVGTLAAGGTVYCWAIYGVSVAPTQYLNPAFKSESVTLDRYNSTPVNNTFSYDVTSDTCNTDNNISFTARPWVWYLRCDGVLTGRDNYSDESTTIAHGIGASLKVNVNVWATITLQNSNGTNPQTLSGTSVSFRRRDCDYFHTLIVSAPGYQTRTISINNGSTQVDPYICNGQERTTNVIIYPPAASPSPSPSSSPNPSASPSPPATGSVTLDPSCPSNTPTLSASWNLAAGTGYNVYVRAFVNDANRDCQIATTQTGSSTLTGTICANTGNAITLQNTGVYSLYGSNGTTTVSDTGNTISCGGGGSGCYNFKCPTKNADGIPGGNCADRRVENKTAADCTEQWCKDNDDSNPGIGCYWPPNGTTTCVPGDQISCNTPKYKCDGASCIRDDANGNFTSSNCNNTCLATCSTNVTMNASPNPATQGGNITFSVGGDAQAAWCMGDTWTAGTVSGSNCDCIDSRPEDRLRCGIWTPVFGTRSCTAASSNLNPYTWTHYWRINTTGINCNTGTQCSKPSTFTINPAISAWIQVTGDVHSNTMIRAPGGP